MQGILSVRGITISVGYASLLAITLPRNLRHLTECIVITSPEDEDTQSLSRSLPGVRLEVTDAFTRHGARFNKGLAFEETWDRVGRGGWWLLHDADILLPDELDFSRARADCLNGARRRILADPSKWTPDLDWSRLPLSRDGGPIGFFQLWDGDCPAIKDKRPWYDVSFGHAGGGDAYFLSLWPGDKRKVMPIDCLHLGPKDTNWFGTDPESRKIMEAFIVRNGWRHSHPWIPPEAADRVGEIVERVNVPGYGISDFELPFVNRAKRNRERRQQRA